MSEKYQSRDVGVFWRDPLPGFVLGSEITYFESPSYTVVVRNVDWKNLQFPTWIDSPISQPTSLIKYSMAEHSPVSENPTDYIQLGTPSYFRFVKAEQGSELMADELESAYVETLDWRKHGSSMMESMKDRFASSFLSVPNDARQKMKWTRDDVLIYCTSVAPETSYDRELHEESISSNYDFATRIVRPSCFAAELGHLFGKQIDYENDLSADLPGRHMLATLARTRAHCLGEYLIIVNHGSVLYLPEEEIETAMNPQNSTGYNQILPFLKRKTYEGQQEYRFVIDVQFHRIGNHTEDEDGTFLLKISEKLRDLMSPIGRI